MQERFNNFYKDFHNKVEELLRNIIGNRGPAEFEIKYYPETMTSILYDKWTKRDVLKWTLSINEDPPHVRGEITMLKDCGRVDR